MTRADLSIPLTRREFARGLALGALGLSGLAMLPGAIAAVTDSLPLIGAGSLPRRLLGRTGLRVSTIGLNLANPTPADVIDFAIDLGINYFDTARRYRSGQSETDLAPVLARRRDEMIVASKWHRRLGSDSADEILATLEASLAALGVDHLDVWLNDSVADPEVASHGPWLEACARAREQGKVRFTGLSAWHNVRDDWEDNLAAVVEIAVGEGMCDVIHLRHSPALFERIGSLAEGVGAGLMAMYILTSSRDQGVADIETPEGRMESVRWALGDESIAGVLVEAPRIADVQIFAAGAVHTATGQC